MSEADAESPAPWISIQGGIRSSGGFVSSGASYPFGRLEFDAKDLCVRGANLWVEARRDDVQAIRLSTGVLATKVQIVRRDGKVEPILFVSLDRKVVRNELVRRGWPVEERWLWRRSKVRHE